MINEKKLICVDDYCELTEKILDNWDSMLEHQQLNHKMLTLQKLQNTIQEIQKSSLENLNQTNKIIQDFELTLQEILYNTEDQIHQQIKDYFFTLYKKLTFQLNENIKQKQNQLFIQGDEFYQKIFESSYQKQVIQIFQEQNSQQWIHDEIDNILCEAEQNTKLFHDSFKKFLDSLVKSDDIKQENSNLDLSEMFIIQEQPKQSQTQQQQSQNDFQDEQIAPLKNYRKLMLKPSEQQNYTLDLSLQSESASQRTEIQTINQFLAPKFQDCENKNLITQFSSIYLYGPLQLNNNRQCVTTDEEGMILIEGFIALRKLKNFNFWIIQRADNFYVEIGVIDWSKFQFPKLDTSQIGVYSLNNKQEMYLNGKTKKLSILIQHDTQLGVTYNQNSQILNFQGRNIKLNENVDFTQIKKKKLTVFVKLSKAQVVIVQ